MKLSVSFSGIVIALCGKLRSIIFIGQCPRKQADIDMCSWSNLAVTLRLDHSRTAATNQQHCCWSTIATPQWQIATLLLAVDFNLLIVLFLHSSKVEADNLGTDFNKSNLFRRRFSLGGDKGAHFKPGPVHTSIGCLEFHKPSLKDLFHLHSWTLTSNTFNLMPLTNWSRSQCSRRNEAFLFRFFLTEHQISIHWVCSEDEGYNTCKVDLFSLFILLMLFTSEN